MVGRSFGSDEVLKYTKRVGRTSAAKDGFYQGRNVEIAGRKVLKRLPMKTAQQLKKG